METRAAMCKIRTIPVGVGALDDLMLRAVLPFAFPSGGRRGRKRKAFPMSFPAGNITPSGG